MFRHRGTLDRHPPGSTNFLLTMPAKDTKADRVAELAADEPSGVDPLLKDGFGINARDRIPAEDRWTHDDTSERHKTRIHHVIASPAVAEMIHGASMIPRAGRPYQVSSAGDLARWHRVGQIEPRRRITAPWS